MKRSIKFIISTTLLILLSACTRQVQEDKLLEKFNENRSKFEKLSELSCSLLNGDFKRWEYNVGDYSNKRLQSKSDDSSKDYDFKWADLNKYGEQFKSDIEKIDGLLVDLDADGILIREPSGECLLYIEVWSMWMTGEGQEMLYVFNPETIYEYNPQIHIKANRDLKAEIDFTLPLSSGWYVKYNNTP